MVRRIGHLLWISAFGAAIIFITGIMLGFGLDNFRSNGILNSLKNNELDTESYLIEQLLIEDFGGDACLLQRPRLAKLSEELGELGRFLTNYKESTLFKQDDYEYLLRRYFLLEVRSYVLLTNFKESCNADSNTIMFFYAEEDEDSKRQGYVLDELVRQNDNVTVFSISKDFDKDPTLETLKLHYNVTQAPTIIINDVAKFEGFTSLSEIKEELGGNSF